MVLEGYIRGYLDMREASRLRTGHCRDLCMYCRLRLNLRFALSLSPGFLHVSCDEVWTCDLHGRLEDL